MKPVDTPRLRDVLQAARRAAGLSPAELAEEMGVSRMTVREAEHGRDPRAGTLAAWLAVLPELSPSELLRSPWAAVPPNRPDVWQLYELAQGFRLRRLRHAVRLASDGSLRSTLSVLGVKALRGCFRGEAGQVALRQAVAAGSSQLLGWLRTAEARAPRAQFEDEQGVHAFRQVSGGRFDYIRTRQIEPADDVEPFAHALAMLRVDLLHAVGALELVLQAEDGLPDAELAAVAWPTALEPQQAEAFLSSLHPTGATVRRTSKSWRVILDRPALAVTHGVSSSEAPADEEARAEDDSLAETLRVSRERAGLSARALSQRMGVSAMTVIEAERGRDPKHSTLQRWLDALPQLSEFALLPGADLASRAVAWDHGAALHGVTAELEEKTVRISAEGNSTLRIETVGLRRTRESKGALRVRLGQARSVLQPTRASMEGVEAAEEEDAEPLRIARIAEPGRPTVHELIIPAAQASRGVSFARRLEHRGVYVMHAAKAREMTGLDEAFHEGASFGALLPTRRLRLLVRCPRGWWPEDVRAHVWPVTQAPDPDIGDAAELLHPEGLPVEVDRRRRLICLEVDRPLVGFKYALSWQLPE